MQCEQWRSERLRSASCSLLCTFPLRPGFCGLVLHLSVKAQVIVHSSSAPWQMRACMASHSTFTAPYRSLAQFFPR